jgi:uncharacterized protein (DUF433 family)
MPAATVGNWVRGYPYPTQAGWMRSKPLVVPPTRKGALSFTNLVEAHTITGFRASGVSMQRLRPALGYLVRHLGVEHPLASENLLTDGVDVFWEYLQESEDGALVHLLNISAGGQAVFADVIRDYLDRIDFASDGYAEKLWPAGKALGVAVDPARGFGLPIIDRRAVRVEHIVERLHARESRRSIARDYGLTAREIDAAVNFEHRASARAA